MTPSPTGIPRAGGGRRRSGRCGEGPLGLIWMFRKRTAPAWSWSMRCPAGRSPQWSRWWAKHGIAVKKSWRTTGFPDQPGQMRRRRAKIVQTSPTPCISTMPGGRAGTQMGAKWRKKNAKLHCSGQPVFETIAKPGAGERPAPRGLHEHASGWCVESLGAVCHVRDF